MGRVFEGILMVTTIYIAYKIGKSDGKKESDIEWKNVLNKEEK